MSAHRTAPLVIAGFVALLGCEGPAPQAAAGCGKDTDCKGDRVCESGRCVAPLSPAAIAADNPASDSAIPPGAPSLAKVRVNTEPDGVGVREDGVEICSSTPCDIIYKGGDADPGRPHQLTFARSGYRPAMRVVRVTDSPVSVTLIAAR
jgi:hypothetical protein